MSIATALLVIGQLQPGPLDAFRANYASIKANCEYTYLYSYAGPRDVVRGRPLRAGELNLAASPTCKTVTGRWECDGRAEHTIATLPEQMVTELRTKMPHLITSGDFRVEQLFDGPTVAHHILGIRSVMSFARGPGTFINHGGAFHWWEPIPFPWLLEERFPGVVPQRKMTERDGRPLEVEVYQKKTRGVGWYRIDVSYDPAIGYLPRSARAVELSPDDGKGWIKELFLLDARPCAAGGFVPVEWYETFFSIKDFATRFPKFDEETVLATAGRDILLGHFRVTKFEDRSSPVRLEHLKDVGGIAGIGGSVPIKGKYSTLTLDRLKTVAGRVMTPSVSPVLANIDEAELNQFRNAPQPSRFPLVILGLAFASLLGLLACRRRLRALFALSLVIGQTGCGERPRSIVPNQSRPIVHLSAAFTQTRLVYEPDRDGLSMTLVVKNDGNQALLLKKVDGGCSCRPVDQTGLPALLKPGAFRSLSVVLHDRRSYEKQAIVFTFETDRGPLASPVNLHAMPSHALSPQTLPTFALDEGEDLTFEIVHREVYRNDQPRPSTRLIVPIELSATRTGTNSGRVAGALEFSYEDAHYLMTLQDRSLGFHKAMLALEDEAGRRSILAVPMLWTRKPFLSASPDRVILGKQPVPAFLVCSDESIELTKVRSMPAGVKAVVSSTRELTVRLADGAPGIIDGSIEVGTTAEGRPPLRIPVVRYAPLAKN